MPPGKLKYIFLFTVYPFLITGFVLLSNYWYEKGFNAGQYDSMKVFSSFGVMAFGYLVVAYRYIFGKSSSDS